MPPDLLGGPYRLFGKRLYFGGNDAETAPGLAGARRLDRCIQCQEICLRGDVRDQGDDLPDLRCGSGKTLHDRIGLARAFDRRACDGR